MDWNFEYLGKAEKLLEVINQSEDELSLDILGSGVVELLEKLSMQARSVPVAEEKRYKSVVELLSNFCKKRGHVNSLKETESLDRVFVVFPELNV